MSESELKDLVRQLIASDDLDAALHLLIKHTDNLILRDGIIIQQARYNDIRKARANGVMPHSEISHELNKLRDSLLSHLRTEKMAPPPAPQSYSLKSFEETLALSLTRVKVSGVLLAGYTMEKGLTITEIVQASRLASRKLVVDYINELTIAGLVDKIKEGGKTLLRLNEAGEKMIKKYCAAE
ncbi:MAG: hypothetical protein JNM22_21495 [Saprospiraceae bacterium]|nr:hypothetical protein [Saprospiraceae bacterium]